MLQSLNLPTIPRRSKSAPAPKQTQRTEPVRRSGRLRNESIQAEKRQKKRQLEVNRLLQQQENEEEQSFLVERPQQKQKRAHDQCESLREHEFQRALRQYPPTIALPFVYPCQLKKSFDDGMLQYSPSSSLEIELDAFHSRCLGIQLLPAGRNTVAQALCPPGYTTRFSIMSKIHLWKNAITLFVRESDGLLYSHMLKRESAGVYFDWSAQAQRQEISSAVMQQLRHTQKGDEELRLNDSYYVGDQSSATTPVLLFLQHAKGPYIYCGRIGYLGFESDSVKFRWQLLDVAAMDWRLDHKVLQVL
ncbi:hypothetical protein GN958_ATG00367 [Phytophthora infestans]|uniref:Uncharacterized protein n=1 Tax=Phytophthora infestans TaxID=4787 RepID=A0A8S9US35_PHYIN|nr:hypothetical protein GN958_ATG08964 [Phytophthora infestans]KAF4150440.1 hypothetical protein GN958_ATG00367 [Phytophthora infestans]